MNTADISSRSHRRACIELAVAMAIVGSSVVAGKMIVAEMPIYFVSALRFGLASLVLIPVALLAQHRASQTGSSVAHMLQVSRKQLFTLALQALFGIVMFNVLLLQGLKSTSATVAGVIVSSAPLVTGLLAVVLLGEASRMRQWLSIILATLGLIFLNTTGNGGQNGAGKGHLLGNLMIFGAVLGEASFTVIGKMLLRKGETQSQAKLSPLVISTYLSLFGFLFFLPFGILDLPRVDIPAISAGNWWLIGYYASGVTVVAFLLWHRGIEVVSAKTAAVYTSVLPLSVIVFAIFFLSEVPSPGSIIGFLLVIAAIIISACGKR